MATVSHGLASCTLQGASVANRECLVVWLRQFLRPRSTPVFTLLYPEPARSKEQQNFTFRPRTSCGHTVKTRHDFPFHFSHLSHLPINFRNSLGRSGKCTRYPATRAFAPTSIIVRLIHNPKPIIAGESLERFTKPVLQGVILATLQTALFTFILVTILCTSSQSYEI